MDLTGFAESSLEIRTGCASAKYPLTFGGTFPGHSRRKCPQWAWPPLALLTYMVVTHCSTSRLQRLSSSRKMRWTYGLQFRSVIWKSEVENHYVRHANGRGISGYGHRRWIRSKIIHELFYSKDHKTHEWLFTFERRGNLSEWGK